MSVLLIFLRKFHGGLLFLICVASAAHKSQIEFQKGSDDIFFTHGERNSLCHGDSQSLLQERDLLNTKRHSLARGAFIG